MIERALDDDLSYVISRAEVEPERALSAPDPLAARAHRDMAVNYCEAAIVKLKSLALAPAAKVEAGGSVEPESDQ